MTKIEEGIDGEGFDDRTDHRGLTAKRRKFVNNVLLGLKPAKAAEVAGYSCPAQAANYLTNQLSIQNAIQRESQRVLMTEGLSNSLRFMVSAPGNEKLPGAVRFQAAKWVMEAAGHGLAAQRAALGLPDSDKPLSEMSITELDAFLAAGRGAIAQIKANEMRTIEGESRNIDTDGVGVATQVIESKGE